jgi:SAM-dependent methyltransferase
MESLSFDGMTALYDQTRTFDPTCFAAALDWLAVRFPPRQFRSVLEPGVGTGRIALPLVGRGYQVTGLDISDEMLGVCVAQCSNMGAGGALYCLRADAARLPLSTGSFDLCVAVHLFYFVPGWRGAVREMLRALQPGGALVLLHTGKGAEVPRLNERCQELALELGYVFPTYGVRSTREVVDYAASLGCAVERAEETAWEWTTRIGAREALRTCVKTFCYWQ